MSVIGQEQSFDIFISEEEPSGFYRTKRIGQKQKDISAMKYLKYVAVILFPSALAHAETPTSPQGVGFYKVSDALDYLRSKPGVSFTTTKPDSWLIANDTSPFAIWSFTPQGHYAYPAVVKRELKTDVQGNVSIEMTALCEATEESCDRLIGEFQVLNAQATKNVQRATTK